MKKIEVVIEGVTPLLMHSCHNMSNKSVTKNPAKQYDPKKDAEEVAYRKDDKTLFVPSRCVKACLINSASWYKFGKKSAKPIIAGSVRIEPYEISLGTKTYEIDLRPVVIQRNRIMRARPRLDKWVLSFDLIYNEKMIADVDILRNIFEEAGQRIGLLDNRPQKYGENGCFRVKKWLPKK